MFRRLLVLFLTLLMTFSLAQAQDAVAIEYWTINNPSFGGPQVETFIAEFQEANPGVTVVHRPFDGYPTIVQTLQTNLAAGNPPDIIQIGYPYRDYVANNLPYIPVDELIAAWGGQETLDQFPQNILDIPVVNGQRIGMAYSLSNPVIYYNADLMTAAGLDPENPPQTHAEWLVASETIRAALDLPSIVYAYGEDNWTLQALVESNGGNMLVCENGEYRTGVNTPEAAAGLQAWADLVQNDFSTNALYGDARPAFLAGEYVALYGSIASRAGLQAEATFDLRATYFPQFGENPVRIPGGGNMLVVFAAEPNKQQAAWNFTQFLLTPQSFTEWTMGTGYVPLIPGLEADPAYLQTFVEENPIQAVGMDQLDRVVAWTSWPGPDGLAAGRALFEAVQSALSGEQTAVDALAAAAEEVNSLIAGQPCAQ